MRIILPIHFGDIAACWPDSVGEWVNSSCDSDEIIYKALNGDELHVDDLGDINLTLAARYFTFSDGNFIDEGVVLTAINIGDMLKQMEIFHPRTHLDVYRPRPEDRDLFKKCLSMKTLIAQVDPAQMPQPTQVQPIVDQNIQMPTPQNNPAGTSAIAPGQSLSNLSPLLDPTNPGSIASPLNPANQFNPDNPNRTDNLLNPASPESPLQGGGSKVTDLKNPNQSQEVVPGAVPQTPGVQGPSMQ